MAQYPQNSQILVAKIPSVHALGNAHPTEADRDGQTEKGRFGEPLAAGLIASGRGTNLRPGSQRNPFAGRERSGRGR